MATKRNSLMGLFAAAISTMLGRTTSAAPRQTKDAYVNIRPTPILKCRAFGGYIGIENRAESYQRTNQKRKRKNARRANAAGVKNAYA